MPVSSNAPPRVLTIAGTGVAGFDGDGGPGAAGQLANPFDLAIGPDGALYICEVGQPPTPPPGPARRHALHLRGQWAVGRKATVVTVDPRAKRR